MLAFISPCTFIFPAIAPYHIKPHTPPTTALLHLPEIFQAIVKIAYLFFVVLFTHHQYHSIQTPIHGKQTKT